MNSLASIIDPFGAAMIAASVLLLGLVAMASVWRTPSRRTAATSAAAEPVEAPELQLSTGVLTLLADGVPRTPGHIATALHASAAAVRAALIMLSDQRRIVAVKRVEEPNAAAASTDDGTAAVTWATQWGFPTASTAGAQRTVRGRSVEGLYG